MQLHATYLLYILQYQRCATRTTGIKYKPEQIYLTFQTISATQSLQPLQNFEPLVFLHRQQR